MSSQDNRKQPFIWLDLDIEELNLDPYAFRLYVRIVRRGRNSSCIETVNSMAEACQMSRRRAAEALRELERRNLIVTTGRTRPNGSTTSNEITITDCSEWARSEPTPLHQVHTPPAQRAYPPLHNVHTPPAPGAYPELDPIEPDPKELDPKEKKSTPPPPPDPLTDLAEVWVAFASTEAPWLKPNRDSYRRDLEKVMRAAKLDHAQLHGIFDFISQDEFWRKNAISPGGLLSKSYKNGLRKIDNILIAMNNDKAVKTRTIDNRLAEKGVVSPW